MPSQARSVIRAIVISVVTIGAAAAEPPDLKGLRAGMSEQELLAVMPSLRCRTPPAKLGDRICSDPKNTIVGQPASVSVTLMNDRTVRVIFYFAAGHAKAVAEAVTKKFGEPFGSISLPAGSGGGELTRKMTTWNISDESQLELSHLPGSDRGTWLSLSDKLGRGEIMKRFRQEQDRKAKDL